MNSWTGWLICYICRDKQWWNNCIWQFTHWYAQLKSTTEDWLTNVDKLSQRGFGNRGTKSEVIFIISSLKKWNSTNLSPKTKKVLHYIHVFLLHIFWTCFINCSQKCTFIIIDILYNGLQWSFLGSDLPLFYMNSVSSEIVGLPVTKKKKKKNKNKLPTMAGKDNRTAANELLAMLTQEFEKAKANKVCTVT